MSSSGPAELGAARRRLRWVHVITQVGDGAFYVTSAVYLVRQGWSAAYVGLALSLAWGVGALSAPRIGRLADRLGVRRVASASLLGAAATLLTLALAPPAASGFILVGYAVAQSAWGGLRAALVELVTCQSGRLAERAIHQRLGNAALAVGAGLGGLALAQSGRAPLQVILALDGAGYVVAASLLRLGLPRHQASGHARVTARLGARHRLAILGSAALFLYMPMLSVALPILVAVGGGMPPWIGSACLAGNTLGVMALQGRAVAAVGSARSARASVAIGGGLLAACTALLWTAVISDRPLLLVAAMLVQVLGEVCFAAGAWDIGYRLAPVGGAAGWLSAYGAAIPMARCLGPALLAPLASESHGWVLAAAVFGVGGLALAAAAPVGPRERAGDGSGRRSLSVRPGTVR